MSHPVITDPAIPSRRGRKSKGSSFLSFPVILIMICSVGGLPPVSARLSAIDGVLHSHNDAIVSVIMAVAPYLLVAFAALGLFVFVRAGRPIPFEPEA